MIKGITRDINTVHNVFKAHQRFTCSHRTSTTTLRGGEQIDASICRGLIIHKNQSLCLRGLIFGGLVGTRCPLTLVQRPFNQETSTKLSFSNLQNPQ